MKLKKLHEIAEIRIETRNFLSKYGIATENSRFWLKIGNLDNKLRVLAEKSYISLDMHNLANHSTF